MNFEKRVDSWMTEIAGRSGKWTVFYWDNFGHCADGGHASRQMKLATRLIDIILLGGLDDCSAETIPYVNMRNKKRFRGFNDWHQPHFHLGEPQEVRFKKAYSLLWTVMKDNLLCWGD